MSLVPAKCPECGGNVVVDSEKDAWICDFCKTPFIVEKAINNFNTVNNITNNITNNNEIKTDVVNVYGEENVDLKLKEFVDKITLSFKLENKDNTLSNEINKFYIYTEKHIEKTIVQETFLSALLDSYYFALEGHSWDFFISKVRSTGSYDREDFLPLDLLFDKVKIIKALDSNKGKIAESKVDAFFNNLYEMITKPISKTNQVSEIKGVYECVEREYGSHDFDRNSRLGRSVNIISLAYGFLICERYPDSYAEIFELEIKPIIEASKKQYLGYLMIFGRFVEVPGYYMYEGYRENDDYFTLLDISITKMSQINELIEINKNRINPHKIYSWEKERRHLSWHLDSLKKCYGCNKKLSITGKCTTVGCKYYNKSIRKEISLIDEKIRKAKMR